MPAAHRTTNGAQRSRPKRGGFLASVSRAALVATSWTALGKAVLAQPAVEQAASFARQDFATLTIIGGLVGFSVLATIALARSRYGNRKNFVSRDEAMTMQAEIDRLKQLLLSQPQILVTWPAASDEPDIIGDTSIVAPRSVEPGTPRVLAFGTWLEPAAAQRLDDAVDRKSVV